MKDIVYSRIFFIGFFILLIFSMTGLSVDSVTWRLTGFNSPYVSIFQIALLAPGMIITLACQKIYKDRFSTIVWTFCIFCLISVFLNFSTSSSRSIQASLFNIFIIPIGISCGKYLSDTILPKTSRNFYLYCLQIPAIFVGWLLITWGSKFNSDCGFAFFLFLPFVFFIKGKFKQIIILVFYGIVVLLTGKRSIFLTYSICLIVYFVYLSSHKESKSQYLNKIIILFCFGIGIYYILSNYSDNLNYIFDRFANIEEDKGSGREDVYASVLSGFKQSDLLQQLFGHGYFSVVDTFNIGAHNDLLEITYDYGLVPLLLSMSYK